MSHHVPVMVPEVVDGLRIAPERSYIDATVGGGGHAAAILSHAPGVRLLGLDRDPHAVYRSKAQLRAFGTRARIVQASFAQLTEVASQHGFAPCDGVLMDLGLSSDQLADESRGFSFRRDGPLDMRFDQREGPTAADLVNELDESDLADLLYAFGEERKSRRIARAIVAARPLETTGQLAEVVSDALGRRAARIHPATRSFQALRIAVNEELTALSAAIPQAIDVLREGGRLVVLSYHSLEDRVVKQALREASRDCICPPELPECRCNHQAVVELVVRRPLRPTETELARNPRARSARLRIAEKLGDAAVDRQARK